VIEQTDLFQKFGKTLVRKYEFKKKSKKSDLNKKSDFFIFLNHDFFQPCVRYSYTHGMNTCRDVINAGLADSVLLFAQQTYNWK